MKDANEILHALEYNSYTLIQLYERLSLPKATIRGRLYELQKNGFIRKLHGKFLITPIGLEKLPKIDKQPYNFMVSKEKLAIKVRADNKKQANSLAKQIYGSNYKVNTIGTN